MQESFKLAQVFQDHMMFQADQPIRLFGVCQTPSTLVVTVLNQKYQFSITPDRFLIELPVIPYQKDCFEILIEDSIHEKIVLSDCIFGDLFIASGQSNMQFTVQEGIYDDLIETKDIRLYEVPKLPYENAHIEFPYLYSSNPKWSYATKEAALKFSAIGFFVASELYQRHHRPIGILSCNMGDTSVFSWIKYEDIVSNQALLPYLKTYQTELDKYRSIEEYNERFHIQLPRLMAFYGEIEKGIKSGMPSIKSHDEAYKLYPDPYIPMGPKHYNRPAGCYETMIEQIVPLSIKGALYYQGESDHQNCEMYEEAFKTLVASWRKRFLNEQLPIIYVQIAGYNYPLTKKDAIPIVREAQGRLLSVDNHCFMVSALDLGESQNIHPRNKTIVSNRISNVIDEYLYHHGSHSLSPEYSSHEFLSDSTLMIKVKNNDLPLKSITGNNLGFSALKEDNQWITIDNIVINAQSILIQNAKSYREIRYAFDNDPKMDIYSNNDLPLLPFRLVL